MKNNNPDFIDNINGNTLQNAIKEILSSTGENEIAQLNNGELRIATAYFSPSGFSRISSLIKNIGSIRLLLGSDPLGENEKWQKKIGESNKRFLTIKFRENLKKQEEYIRKERNHISFTRESGNAIKQLVKSLRSGNMEVKRFEENFLHAKAYIFSNIPSSSSSSSNAVIAGSSNLTGSGLASNLELNLGRFNPETFEKAQKWFDELWDKAKPFDLASFFEEIFEPKSPYDIFLRVLWELYGDDIEEESIADDNLPLTTFQMHGVARAKKLIRETGGVIVADEVGLGKTFIAAEILKEYRERRQKVLLICPAALRDSAWKKFKNEYDLYLETYSFEEIAQDKQLWDAYKRPNAKSNHIQRDIEDYQLIIIDEAHNYRNPDSPSRADALRSLLYGKRKDVLMLTATPVNNSLWDLYHLTRYFLKQDSYLANKGILSIKERFDYAMRTNPRNLSPDVLYPIIDATTVKRTRQFIRKHYPNDYVRINGKNRPIVFPDPKAISVRYEIDKLMPGLFDLVEKYFDPENANSINFSRYKSELYLKNFDTESEISANATTGLLLSGLLKRFESSTGAFISSISKIIEQHKNFLKALDAGYVVSTEFLTESLGSDDEEFDEFLDKSTNNYPIEQFNTDLLKKDVKNDLAKLEEIFELLKKISPEKDPKLIILLKELKKIIKDAKDESISREDEINKRKVIIFSFYADTVKWINDFLLEAIKTDDTFSVYKDRIEIIFGSKTGIQMDKTSVAARFAPKTAGQNSDEDLTDVLISTDVLAEGVNLQQARHIINYDLPWNPMKLVQRHGRIDRIGSEHNMVFMRTIFPTDRLDALLGLEEKISRKIAMAAASVGIVSPLSEVDGINRNFTETKEEIEKLINNDSSLYERGGTLSSIQSGEEYRQTLRKELQIKRNEIINMPWKAGSGIKKGKEQGMFFCAKVGDRNYLRFIHTDEQWQPKKILTNNEESTLTYHIEIEIGKCLRLIECDDTTTIYTNENVLNSAYDLWEIVKNNIYSHWNRETDPKNLQPKIRPLNRKVAEFIRENRPSKIDNEDIEKALDIIESPWSRRDEKNLKFWFEQDNFASERATFLIEKILKSGLEAFICPDPLPPIEKHEIELIVWMALKDE